MRAAHLRLDVRPVCDALDLWVLLLLGRWCLHRWCRGRWNGHLLSCRLATVRFLDVNLDFGVRGSLCRWRTNAWGPAARLHVKNCDAASAPSF